MLPGPSDSPRTRVRCQTLPPGNASCPHQWRESQSGTLESHTESATASDAAAFLRRIFLPDTLWGLRRRRATRRAGRQAVVVAVTAAPAALAASRTAPATAPATLSLKTLGMM
ncbi:hypothetical protein GCM10010218_18630 [Streptomyces mashuensis]|uniref:Uncharacterized protein n=1 Tax=Streptomyces mashuensis TaxID=33904 RepID=A0A919B1V1_9ACTN|nr:hypothetical protein GCM10010218_18630 [Streptomyces mashuensis]